MQPFECISTAQLGRIANDTDPDLSMTRIICAHDLLHFTSISNACIYIFSRFCFCLTLVFLRCCSQQTHYNMDLLEEVRSASGSLRLRQNLDLQRFKSRQLHWRENVGTLSDETSDLSSWHCFRTSMDIRWPYGPNMSQYNDDIFLK